MLFSCTFKCNLKNANASNFIHGHVLADESITLVTRHKEQQLRTDICCINCQKFHKVNLIVRSLLFAIATIYNTQFVTFTHARRNFSMQNSLIRCDSLVNNQSPDIVEFFPATPDRVIV